MRDSRLYHYTDANGLLGIVTSETVRAADILFLNDLQEFRTGLDIAVEYVGARIDGSKNDSNRERWIYVAKQLEGLHSRRSPGSAQHQETDQLDSPLAPVYSASFSCNGDLLSQWRAYCPRGGYSIGFPQEHLQKRLIAQHFRLIPCIYEPKEQQESVANLIEDLVGAWIRRAGKEQRLEDDNSRFLSVGKLVWELLKFLPAVKDTAFQEEYERRAISTPELIARNHQAHFRTRGATIVPYVEIDLKGATELWMGTEVIVGPCPHPDEAVRSVRRLLLHEFRCHPQVRVSEAPYRFL